MTEENAASIVVPFLKKIDDEADATFENLTMWDIRLVEMHDEMIDWIDSRGIDGLAGEDWNNLIFHVLDVAAGWRDEDQEEDGDL